MNFFKFLLSILCCLTFFTSCSKHDDSNTNMESDNLTNNQNSNELQLPCTIDLKLGYDDLPIYNTKEWEQWDVSLKNDVYVLENSGCDKPAPPGMFPPALRLGVDDWCDYSVSFDFFIGTSGRISFVLYDKSNIFCPENSDFNGEQQFWFSLHSDGRISYETTSIADSCYLMDDSGEYLTVKDFDSNIWNTISLKNNNGNLDLIVNGVKIATLDYFVDNRQGRLALDGSVGCMFKNICFE